MKKTLRIFKTKNENNSSYYLPKIINYQIAKIGLKLV